MIGRKKEGESFSGPCFGDGDDVSVSEGDGPSLGLDWGRRREPGRPEGPQQLRRDPAEILEALQKTVKTI